MKIKLGDIHGLAIALRIKRGENTKTWAAKQVGVSVSTYSKLENTGERFMGNTDYHSQHLARWWVNEGTGFYSK